MRIDNGGQPIEPKLPTQSTRQAKHSAAANAETHSTDTSTSVHTNSIEGLLQNIVSSGEIRESVVNDIKIKIQTGEYLAKQSAFQTASAILNL